MIVTCCAVDIRVFKGWLLLLRLRHLNLIYASSKGVNRGKPWRNKISSYTMRQWRALPRGDGDDAGDTGIAYGSTARFIPNFVGEPWHKIVVLKR